MAKNKGDFQVSRNLIVDNRLGVGTDSPASIIHAQSSSSVTGKLESTGNEYTLLQINNSNTSSQFDIGAGPSGDDKYFIWGYGNRPLSLGTNGTERVQIDSSGNVSFSTYGSGALSSDGSGNISSGTLSIANGGTGASDAATARSNLGVAATNSVQFLAYDGTGQTNVTGNNTDYTCIFDTESYDDGADYNASTGVFTAPSAGTYSFAFSMVLGGFTSSATFCIAGFNFNSSINYRVAQTNLGLFTASSGGYVIHGSIIRKMAASETMEVFIQINGEGSNVVDIGSGETRTWFSGKLIDG